jgi:hypothetical protein
MRFLPNGATGIAAVLLAFLLPAAAADDRPNLKHPVPVIEQRLHGPLTIEGMEQARPSIEGDRSARVELSATGGLPAMAVKWKPVAPPGEGFNNEPRYELAAYRFQKMFLDECEYVVPPVVLRALPSAEYSRLRDSEPPTLRRIDSVVFMLSYWLSNVSPDETWDPERFERDPRYARHWGNLNILTHLIDHKDANYGNLLISRNPGDPRVFAVDSDVAFAARASDRGDEWRRLHVDRLPEDTLERLRGLSRRDLDRELGVLAEFRVENDQLVPVHPPGRNLSPGIGVRTSGDRVQFGLTTEEIRQLWRRLSRMLSQVNRGRIESVARTEHSIGAACLGVAAQ